MDTDDHGLRQTQLNLPVRDVPSPQPDSATNVSGQKVGKSAQPVVSKQEVSRKRVTKNSPQKRSRSGPRRPTRLPIPPRSRTQSYRLLPMTPIFRSFATSWPILPMLLQLAIRKQASRVKVWKEAASAFPLTTGKTNFTSTPQPETCQRRHNDEIAHTVTQLV